MPFQGANSLQIITLWTFFVKTLTNLAHKNYTKYRRIKIEHGILLIIEVQLIAPKGNVIKMATSFSEGVKEFISPCPLPRGYTGTYHYYPVFQPEDDSHLI